MKPTKLLLITAALAASGAAGCSRRAPAPAAPTAPPVAATANDDAAAREAAERARLAAEADARRREESARVRAVLSTPVYFDYDSHAIREDSRRDLDAKLPPLLTDAAIRLRIAGHTDERGSTEYNLALGMRRAEAVREYLTNLGVDPSRVDITSYGEEMPAVEGSSESAWSRNRRAEFELTAGPSGM